MNKKNLQRMADYIKTIPQEKFDMDVYRMGNELVHDCDSVGCVLGHCTVLDTKENWEKFAHQPTRYMNWCLSFTGIDIMDGAWDWCFSDKWAIIDNTPKGASKRIEWLINNGLPSNAYEQMKGRAELCY